MNRLSALDRAGAALGAPWILFVLLPLTVYALNPGSVEIPKSVVIGFGVTLCALCALALWPLTFAPRVGSRVVAALEAATATLFVLVLVPNRTGEVSGLGEDFGQLTDLVPALKLALLFAAALVWRKLRPAPFHATLQAIRISAVGASIAIVLLSTSDRDAARRTAPAQLGNLLALGQESNVVIVVLDSFTGYRMVEILDEHPEMRAALAGFTLFPRAIAPALNTPAGSSAILTGDLRFAIEVEDEGERNALALEHSFLAEAARKGFEAVYFTPLDVARFAVPTLSQASLVGDSERTVDESARSYLAFTVESTARILPGFAVRWQQQLLRRAPSLPRRGDSGAAASRDGARTGPELSAAEGQLALERFVELLHVGSGRAKSILLHSTVSHAPWNFTEDGKFVYGAGWRSSSVFAARLVVRLTEKLRALGALDDTLLIVTSDHGSLPVEDESLGGLFGPGDALPLDFNPLVMIKPRRATQPLRVSEMTVWVGDVAATVRDELDLPEVANARFATRSLLAPEQAGRVLELPLFVKPEAKGYRERLQNWTRTDVRGTFVQIGQAMSPSAGRLLARPARIVLSAGEDRRALQLMAEGWSRDLPNHHVARVEIAGRVVASLQDSGVLVLSDADGGFEVKRFAKARRGLAQALEAPRGTNVFALALQVPRTELPPILRRTLRARSRRELVNCVLVTSPRARPSRISECASGDLVADLAWP